MLSNSRSLYLLLASLIGLSPLELAAIEMRMDQHFPISKHVVIEGSFVDVRVEGDSRSDVHIKGTIEEVGLESNYTWSVVQAGDETRVKVASKGAPSSNVDGRMAISVPKGTNIKIINSSGCIWLGHLNSDDVSLRSASGKIVMQNCRGKYKASTVSGEIDASNMGGSLQLRSVSGNQHLDQIEGLVVSRTTSGHVELFNSRGDIEIESACGPIFLENIKGDLEIDSKSGEIKVRGLHIQDDCVLRSRSSNIYVEGLQNMERHDVHASSQTGSVMRSGQNLGRKWRQEGPEKKLHIQTVSGQVYLGN